MPPSEETPKTWNDMYNRLVSYKERFGNCLVPRPYKECTKLGNWVHEQRRAFKNNKLSYYQIDKLESIGFLFILRQLTPWDDMYDRLVSYKQKHGNCLVPTNYKEDKQLGIWVNTQRMSYKNNILSNDRIDKLKSIGFIFSIKQHIPWNDMYKRLVSYKEMYGNCLVPQFYENDKQLGFWVNNQKTLFRNNKLSNEKLMKLQHIGLIFNPLNNNKQQSLITKAVAVQYEPPPHPPQQQKQQQQLPQKLSNTNDNNEISWC